MPTVNTNNKWELQTIEIIKCKDCKYYFKPYDKHDVPHECWRLVDNQTDELLVVKEDDFCSFGERKNESN